MGEKLAAGKNLSPKPLNAMKSKLQQAPPFQVAPSFTVDNPMSWDTFAVWPPWVVDRTSAQTTTNAVPPASPLLGSPASVGKLLQRKALPPLSRKQSAAVFCSAPSIGLVVVIW